MAVKLTDGALPPGEAADKIMALASGLAGVGKTGFALSFPAPFWYYNLDRPIGHFHERWATQEMTYEAVILDVDLPSSRMAEGYLAKFDALVREAIVSKSNGTFVIDGWDIFWDLVKIAKVKNLDSDLPKEYAGANEYMNSHLRRLGLSQLNVVFTTMASKVWTGAKTETDRMKADGFKHKDRWLTHEVYLFTPENMSEPLSTPKQGDMGQTHRAWISKSKINEQLVGRVVPSLTFELLYKMTFGVAYAEPERLWSPAKAGNAQA